jgi:hypothetical protein
MGDELLNADEWIYRWTEMTEPIVAFRNFANAPKTVGPTNT